MDIEEIKKNWLELNERLEKKEKVNHEAIRKFLIDKTVGEYDKIRNQEKTCVIIGILTTILFPLLYLNGNIHNFYSFIIVEVFVLICLIYSLICLLALSKFDKNNLGLVWIMKSTLRYKKLYAFVALRMILGIGVGLTLFFFLEGKSFESDNFHKILFFSAITIAVFGATYAYKKTMVQIKEVKKDIEELHKFENE